MFFHNFKYALKTLIKDRMLLFWTFAFPLILGTFFQMAFSNIENSETFDSIPIAIVDNEAFHNNSILKETFKELGEENENQLFTINYTTKEEAEELLNKKEIDGFLLVEENPQIIVSSSGINETILKYVVEEIVESEKIIKNVVSFESAKYITEQTTNEEIAKIMTKVKEEVLKMQQERNPNIKDETSSNMSYTMIEFYTLIAMTCLYGGILGMVVINHLLPNMSNNGKRVSISPASKGKLILSSVLASYMVQLFGLALLFIYTIFVLKVDYGNHLVFLILLSLLGSLAGLSLGIFVASVFKVSENTKTGIMISITMFWCFLSGMMGITMKYIIDTNLPILNKINPASQITDGFYSLYYYPTYERFYWNCIGLLVFSCCLLFISSIYLRRQKYDHI